MSSELMIFVIAAGFGLFGAVSIIDPERAFRLENTFQVSDVELTDFGRDMQMLGGAVGILAGWLIVGGLLPPAYLVLYIVSICAPTLYWYRETFSSLLSPNDQ